MATVGLGAFFSGALASKTWQERLRVEIHEERDRRAEERRARILGEMRAIAEDVGDP
jgi:hypothetical protein